MKIIKTINELRELIAAARLKGKKIGLVPTMGYLHAGHLSLVRAAKAENQLVVVSIFVNPIQFGPNEDFARYPRDLERDSELVGSAGADLVFAPAVDEMYPQTTLTWVGVEKLGDWLCGKSRPVHFRGVTTVVSKLFNIVQPDNAYFGQKDAQQLAIIRRMVNDLNFPVRIVAGPIVRESDGLALSSRNLYLSDEERTQATVLYRALQEAKRMYLNGERYSAKIKQAVSAMIKECPTAKIDYVEICDPVNVQPLERIGDSALLAMAVYFGTTRLIDNIVLMEE